MRLEKSRSGYYPKGHRTKEAIASRAALAHASSRSGTRDPTRPNWRQVAAEKARIMEQETLQEELAQQVAARKALAFSYYVVGYEQGSMGDDFIRGWDTAQRRNPL